MSEIGVIGNIIENKLMDLHTAYVAKVISISGNRAMVQPLTMYKEAGSAAQKPAVVGADILRGARYKLRPETITYVSSGSDYATPITKTVMVGDPLSRGDIVFCACAERDSTEQKRGRMSESSVRRHSLSDSVIVGVIG